MTQIENSLTINPMENQSQISFVETLVLRGFRSTISCIHSMQNTSIFSLVMSLVKMWLSSMVILWVSVFIYLTFYYVYIPLVSTTKQVHLQFDSKCNPNSDTKCANPFARISFTDYSSESPFIRGQMYRLSMEMCLPESEVNWSQGMFMVRLKLLDHNNFIVVNEAKPAILGFKSLLTRIINTLFYWPLIVSSLMEETQTIIITLTDDFIEGSYHNVGPVSHAIIELEARDIQISPPTMLRISAKLTGLRYYMHYWPLTSGVIGTLTINCFIYFLLLLSHSRKVDKDLEDKSMVDTDLTDFGNNEQIKEICDTSGLENIVPNDCQSSDCGSLPDSSNNL